ncbi:histone deacetylase family protein [Pseudohalioglobus sediminis]|uniref:Histone deacetylase family protein n=1 Tax=Pseudohalioglobus sediminis TaxID=2606449 RepID=A0A5B0WQJ2_9GAMM|nr:histone deacetylase family protein [Pseudohalioglobus sediminis]KAA1189153.1 histone deacetylase family protein [Pseudohalioglobus sediminis]
MSIGYITHHHCQMHEMGDYHPEQPARLTAINDRLIATGLDMVLRQYDALPASREQVAAAHESAYIDTVFRKSPEHGHVSLDGDTSMNPFSLQAALHAAGAVVQGVDKVMSGELTQVFCGVRPPGHHAERDKAMGFCLFNNIAVGAYHALEKYGLERIAIVDFDVHHGNGTEDIVKGDERILFCSSFQHPLYPHTGHGTSAANITNVPLPAGCDGPAFRSAISEHWLPRLAQFQPQLVMISAGFDAHQADPLADFNLVDEDFAWVTRRLCEQADASAEGRIVSSLEGGYDLHALARCVEAHLKAMLGDA